ncbi:hypothetical protein P4O66_009368 [Electrophorus voltai]|uniref:IMD domain-containing protein n=1 Tax=Electrophorus voltai TaxID=2609070 RepID=A0AAD8ZB96_9TELE|nr:hypothetical protein P4O66_009368 [Electrophorus voltai]
MDAFIFVLTGATKEIGSALTRMCMRHRSIENKLKQFTTALMDNLINPLEVKIEEWKKVAAQLDKDHAKEYKKARADIKKKSSDTIKLQKKMKKGKDEVRMQLDSALQDVNTRYAELEETEKRAVCQALIEERGRFCSFVTMLRPVLGWWCVWVIFVCDEEITMLAEVTHLQSILEDLCNLTADPSVLPPASEQVILDLKGSDTYNYTYQTPPASPSNTLSRKSSISSTYTSVRHVPSLDSISSAVDGLHLRALDPGQRSRTPLLLVGGEGGSRSLSEGNSPTALRSGCRAPRLRHRNTPQTAREQLVLALGSSLNSEAPRTSRDSLHCSSGYSTQTTTPSCSEDTIPSQHAVKKEPPLYDYDYISLHGGDDACSQLDFDKSCTVPRNSDLSLNYRNLFQSRRPASTVSLLVDPEPLPRQPHTATIRRKPSSKPSVARRGTISGGVPIPICTPQVPLKPSVSTVGLGPGRSEREEAVTMPPPAQTPQPHGSDLAHARHSLCISTQSLSAMPPPYYAMFPGPPLGGNSEQNYQTSKQQQQQRPHHQYASQQPQPPPKQPQYPQQHNPAHKQNYSQPQYQHLPQHRPAQHAQLLKQPHPEHLHHQLQQQPTQQEAHRQHEGSQHTTAPHSSSGRPTQGTPARVAPANAAIPAGGGDMLSMIRRGVKLRRTLTNDRSAPLITANYLN